MVKKKLVHGMLVVIHCKNCLSPIILQNAYDEIIIFSVVLCDFKLYS